MRRRLRMGCDGRPTPRGSSRVTAALNNKTYYSACAALSCKAALHDLAGVAGTRLD